jgi:translation initiation factor IF-3
MAAQARKHHICAFKELRLRYEIDDHDYQVKLRGARTFLRDGDRIKLSVTLRGQIEHVDLALALLQRFGDDLSEFAVPSSPPKLDGRTAVLVLLPSVE